MENPLAGAGPTIADLEAAARALYEPRKSLVFGSYVLGYGAGNFAYGLLLLQVYQWLTTSWSRERISVRAIVGITFLLSTLVTALNSKNMFLLFVTGYDVYWKFLTYKTVTTDLLVASIMQLPICFFFSRRAYELSDRRQWVVWMTFPFLIMSVVSALLLKILSPEFGFQLFDPAYQNARRSLHVYLAAQMVAELTITCTITWALTSKRTSVEPYQPTDPLITKIMVVGLESQLVPTMFSSGFLISSFIYPEYHVSSFFMCTPVVYVVSLLGMLNARHYLQRDLAPEPTFDFARPIVARLESAWVGDKAKNDSNDHIQTEIRVQTETIRETYHLEPVPFKPSINRDYWAARSPGKRSVNRDSWSPNDDEADLDSEARLSSKAEEEALSAVDVDLTDDGIGQRRRSVRRAPSSSDGVEMKVS
ncbi:hypothetical protein IAU60_000029 [Kwoniella sp. DSM 27419]